MPSGTDFIGAFRAYAQKAMGNEFNAEKAAAALNSWVKESGEALRDRIERDTERAVKKLGLAKESDLRALADELARLRKALGIKESTSAKKRATKSSSSSKSRTSSGGAKRKARPSGAVKKGSGAAKKKSAKKK
jgi:cell shape-determining protein MreC